jgi:hypothetical protein
MAVGIRVGNFRHAIRCAVPFGVALACACGAAQAQIKCWNEAGRRVCGDTPPAGARVTTVPVPAAPAPDPAAAKETKKPPLSPAEREQEFRRRQLEAQKAAAKAEEERQQAVARGENCERAREALRALESGERIVRVDAKGERYFLEEEQIRQEAAKARQLVQQWCG